MNCPKCGTWNPDDKKQCWRCDAELPKPESPKPKRKPVNWLWIAVGLFLLITLTQACWALQMRQPVPFPAGAHLPAAPSATWTVDHH